MEYLKAENNALLYEICEELGIPEGAWTQQDLLMEEYNLIRLQGQKLKIPMYRFRGSKSEKNAIVCMIGRWTDYGKKGDRDYRKNLKYGGNYMAFQALINIERSKETGKLIAIFREKHTTWKTLSDALGLTKEHIPMPKTTPERLQKHKTRKTKIESRYKSPPNSDNESEDSYNS